MITISVDSIPMDSMSRNSSSIKEIPGTIEILKAMPVELLYISFIVFLIIVVLAVIAIPWYKRQFIKEKYGLAGLYFYFLFQEVKRNRKLENFNIDVFLSNYFENNTNGYEGERNIANSTLYEYYKANSTDFVSLLNLEKIEWDLYQKYVYMIIDSPNHNNEEELKENPIPSENEVFLEKIKEEALLYLTNGDKRTAIRFGYFVFECGLIKKEKIRKEDLIAQWKKELNLPEKTILSECQLILNPYYDDEHLQKHNNFSKESVDASIDKIRSFFFKIKFQDGLDRIEFDLADKSK